MAEIVKIKKDGVIQYPITKPECVIDENGKNVLQLIKENGGGSSYDDTEVKEELARLEREKADKSELTELSAQVGGLSERIENLPSGGSEVFKAVYGVTTIEEVTEAYNAGKVIHCDYDGMCYILSAFNSGQAFFTSLSANHSSRLELKQDSRWAISYFQMEVVSNKTKTINESSTDTQYPSAKAVYDAIQQSGGGGGMTTPSGDPMHYMFEAVGAEWNGTGADIEKQGVYGDTITHKAGYWYLNELGDITNEEMRTIYAYSFPMQRRMNIETAFAKTPIRTNIAVWDADRIATFGSFAHSQADLRGVCAGAADMETFAFIKGSQSDNIQKHLAHIGNSFNRAFYGAIKLRKIIGYLNVKSVTDYQAFMYAEMLEEVRMWNITNDFSFAYCSKLSKASLLFAITNSAATKAITITLHADAYARLAEDADIVAALAEKEFVSLAK